MQKLNPDDKRKIWQVMEIMKTLKRDTELEVMTRAKCAENDLEVILAKLNARERS
jgi:hypothetical protein